MLYHVELTVSEWVGLALEGLATAAIIGLATTLVWGSVTLLLAHFCVVTGARGRRRRTVTK